MRRQLTKQPAMTVSFSGMDGAGKSTQIEAFSAHLKDAGISVRVIAFWDEVAMFTRFRETAGHTLFRGDKGVGSPEAPIERRDKNVRSWFMTPVRLFLYFADALALRSVVRKSMNSGVGVVIFDRYAYDELVNLNLNRRAVRIYAKLILKLVPRPQISYVLDADPVQARARKPEYPVEFLHTCRESYLALSRLTGALTLIAPMPVQEVEREIWIHAL
ncbi:MAG: thymidylate kinase, partial [Acidobacteriaceae bacterium]